MSMGRCGTLYLCMLVALTLFATSCTSPTEPDNSLPTNVSAYQYINTAANRYFAITPVPDTCGGCADTLVDSVLRIYTDAGIYWSHSYRFVRHWVYDSTSGNWIHVGDDPKISRREGILADSLLLDPSLQLKLLVAPVQAGTHWFVDDSATLEAVIVAEETLTLGIGAQRTWHVTRGAMGDEWWAPGLGRVQYEELVAGGGRRQGRLIGVGEFP